MIMQLLISLIVRFLPESPRWLISKKKFKQAEMMISKMAKINGTRVPENMFDEQDQEQPEEKVYIISTSADASSIYLLIIWMLKTLRKHFGR